MKRLMMLMCLCTPMMLCADIFEDPKNLKVLQEDISPADLRQSMRMMSTGLGVRCQHCHVGEENQSLKTMDFADDEKEQKEKARFMLKMMMELNQKIATGLKDRSVTMKCATCHRGAAKPILTIDSLKEKYAESGVDEALTHYDDLRAKYFGTHTHNFREWTLINLAIFVQASSPASAEKVLVKNLSLYPDSFQTIVNLGDVNMMQEKPQQAHDLYVKAKSMKDKPQPWLDQKIAAAKEQL